jgi:hypothetical protein
MMTPEMFAEAFVRPTSFKQVVEMRRDGKDIWPSRRAAMEWFSKRMPWSRWDARVLRLLVVSAVCWDVSLSNTQVMSGPWATGSA